jgi:hypothetical protein
LVYVSAVAILLVAGVFASLRTAGPVNMGSGPRAAGGAGHAAGPARLGTFSPSDLLNTPAANPFLGTREDVWADGAAGVVAPAARPAGPFTAAQVSAAYATTRKLLIASALDRQTLLGGQPTAFARLLSASQRATFLAGLGRLGVSTSGYPLSTRTWIVSFAPGTTALVGTVIKAHGTMSARVVTESGKKVLTVEVRYLFAYAVEPPHDPVDWTRAVVSVQGSVDFVQPSHPGRASGALEPRYRMLTEAAGPRCAVGDGYIYPDYPGESEPAADSAGLVINPYASPPDAWPDVACSRADGI